MKMLTWISLMAVLMTGCATTGINNGQVDSFEKYGYQIRHFERTDFWGITSNQYDIFQNDKLVLRCEDNDSYNHWRLYVMMDLIRAENTSNAERQALALEYQDLRQQINNSNMVVQNMAANYMLQKMK